MRCYLGLGVGVPLLELSLVKLGGPLGRHRRRLGRVGQVGHVCATIGVLVRVRQCDVMRIADGRLCASAIASLQLFVARGVARDRAAMLARGGSRSNNSRLLHILLLLLFGKPLGGRG